MAKALLGYMSSDQQFLSRQTATRLAAENRALRERVADLETLIVRLSEENEALAATRAATLLEPVEDMQPV
ncbi:hypothetical protein [Nocardioides jensenii]|uniref:hypothetical protein n=1 Tax=Nocardioides jensenii TaxID=1843 RepID=UPI000832619D|nr:hypothetical protein [Nocardioides jensenii]